MSEAKANVPVLRLENITMQFGGVVAINNLSMEVNEGEIVALIGPNGAGKTTAFNCITGVYEPTNGAVYFHGKPIAVNHPTGKMVRQYAGINGEKYLKEPVVAPSADKITALGIARTFQNIRLFKSQTALTDELGEFIVDIKNRFHLTVLMIEHHMNLVMDISDRIYVLDFGKQIAQGTPEEVQRNPVVISAYLGVEEE